MILYFTVFLAVDLLLCLILQSYENGLFWLNAQKGLVRFVLFSRLSFAG